MSIELYIVRHGLAGEHGSYPDDTQRPLTDDGKHKTKQIAKRLAERQVEFDLILTSPLVRARQTAEILQAEGLGDRLEESKDLAPNGDFTQWLVWFQDWLSTTPRTLAIVGHEPDLSEWAERLLWGEPRGRLILKKGGVIGLLIPTDDSPVGRSQLFWLTPPRLLL